MKHTVVLTAQLPDLATRILSTECDVITHIPEGPRSEEEMIDLIADADAVITLVTDPVTRRVLEANPNLRIVGNYGVGTDSVDLPAAKSLGITVTNTPGVLTEATADLTLALILAVTRRLNEAEQFLRRGEFSGWQPLLLLGASLQNRRLGIIGLGRIGAAVATRAQAFGMDVVHFSGSRNRESQIESLPLDELLATSDIVSLHCPLTADTRHIINDESLRMMKRGSYLINTGRGALVDEAALVEALRSGHLRGAGLDVYENEPAVHPGLLERSDVVLVPHIGSATEEAREAMARIVATDVLMYLRTGRAQHIVEAP